MYRILLCILCSGASSHPIQLVALSYWFILSYPKSYPTSLLQPILLSYPTHPILSGPLYPTGPSYWSGLSYPTILCYLVHHIISTPILLIPSYPSA